MDQPTGTMADRLRRRSAEILAEAEPAMTRLAGIAQALKMRDAQLQLQESLDGLRRPEFNMMVFGRFNNGKSTFLNTLLMEHPEGLMRAVEPPLIMGPDPATARLTTVRHSETVKVTIVHVDNRREVHNLDWYRKNCGLEANEARNREFFKTVAEIEVEFPFENGRAGIVLVDTPGTDEALDRNDVVQKAMNRADAGIVVFSSMAAFGQSEMEFMKRFEKQGLSHCFIVVNMFNREADAKMLERAWDKIVREMRGGPAYDQSDRNFAAQRIYFVNALQALEGRREGNADAVQRSGILQFESALNQFYETDRRKVHVQRWADLADSQAVAMTEFIDEIVPNVSRDQESFRKAYEEIRPRIVEARARQAKIPKLFTVFRERAVAALMANFQEVINDIRAKLPAKMMAAELTEMQDIGDKVWAVLSPGKRERAVEEAYGIARAYVESRIKAWGDAIAPEPGANRTLEPLIDELLADLKDEVRQTESEFEKLQFSLAGYRSRSADRAVQDEDGTWWGRVLPTVAGLAFGPDMAVLGAAQGWKGFGKGVLVHVGVLGAVAIFASNPLGWAAAGGWIAAFVIRSIWQGHDLAAEIREKVIQGVIAGDPANNKLGLQDEVKNAAPELDAAVHKMMDTFEVEFCKAFAIEIEQKVKLFEESQRQNALEADQKAVALKEYANAKLEIKQHRATLERVRRIAANV